MDLAGLERDTWGLVLSRAAQRRNLRPFLGFPSILSSLSCVFSSFPVLALFPNDQVFNQDGAFGWLFAFLIAFQRHLTSVSLFFFFGRRAFAFLGLCSSISSFSTHLSKTDLPFGWPRWTLVFFFSPFLPLKFPTFWDGCRTCSKCDTTPLSLWDSPYSRRKTHDRLDPECGGCSIADR